MGALPSSAFLATSQHPSRRPLFHISAARTSRRPLFRSSAVRTEEKPLRTTIHLPDKPSTTTTTTTTTTQPQLEKSRSPRSSPPPTPAGGRSTAAPPSIPAALCNALDFLINNFVDPAVHRPSVDPRHVLSDNWAPVGELPPTPCPVVRGCIPRCLAGGVYIRNGPNPQHLPRGPHHLFDGDGMLHSLLLLLPSTSATGDAVLCSRVWGWPTPAWPSTLANSTPWVSRTSPTPSTWTIPQGRSPPWAGVILRGGSSWG